MISQDISQLPANQKLMLIEEIWNSILHRQADFESPAWHGEIIKERLKNLAEGKDEMLPFDMINAR